MHKTGSTSIQKHFHRTTYPGLTYTNWSGQNHSELFVLLFEEFAKLADYHIFQTRGPAHCARLPQLRTEWQNSLTEEMNALGDKTLLFSAEAISGARYRTANLRMAEFFRLWTRDITMMAYVRGPRSYAASSFQQALQGPVFNELKALKLVPSYRARFLQLDDAFGAASVILKPFAR